MANDFDMDSLRLGPSAPSIEKTKKSKISGHVYKTKPGELFLKGPIPRQWIQSAAQLPGKALHVGIELWFYAGLTKSRTIGLNLSRMISMGVSRDSARRGLCVLEKRKLVSVKRHAGRKPIVTIILSNKTLRRKSRSGAKS